MFQDDNGYEPTTEHLTFLGLTAQALSDCELRKCPLGMTVEQFDALRASLRQALDRDRVFECDIRLKGSSAYFYSGYHKPMPWTRNELLRLLRATRKGVEKGMPGKQLLDTVENCINSVWPSSVSRPQRRPFDSMFRIGVDR